MTSTTEVFDFVIIGSGFGGSVSAMRLAQKGYKVAVLEAGKRWADDQYAKSNWDFKRYLWMPWIKCFGIQKFSLLNGIFLLHGAGVGGGSLVYANTLMTPHHPFSKIKNGQRGLIGKKNSCLISSRQKKCWE